MTVTATIEISGMTCDHCVHAVRKELTALPATVISVTIGAAVLTYGEGAVSRADIEHAVAEAGYAVTRITEHTAVAGVPEQ